MTLRCQVLVSKYPKTRGPPPLSTGVCTLAANVFYENQDWLVLITLINIFFYLQTFMV